MKLDDPGKSSQRCLVRWTIPVNPSKVTNSEATVNIAGGPPLRGPKSLLPEIHAGLPVFYEELLNREPRWALSEGSRHFQEDSAVFKALHGIAKRLKSIGVSYAVVGGMALFRHGLRRFTEAVELLVTKSDLKLIHEKLVGLGFVPPFKNSKQLRDTELGVRIEFLTAGDFPGDGKAKPVAFPDPSTVSFEADDVSYVTLPTLVELKLASGMTGPGRLKDIADVQELIKVLDLPLDFGKGLDPYVQGKFNELWKASRKRFVKPWHAEELASSFTTIEEKTAAKFQAAEEWETMIRDGVVVEIRRDADGDRVFLMTTDTKVAQKYGFIDEADYWEVDGVE